MEIPKQMRKRYKIAGQFPMRKGILPCINGFSQLKASEFFVFRKMEMPETDNHPLCGCA